jgi:hypothetical protein
VSKTEDRGSKPLDSGLSDECTGRAGRGPIFLI